MGLPLDRERIVVLSPFARPDGRLVAAALRAGATALLDLGRDPRRAAIELDEVTRRSDLPFGVRVTDPASDPFDQVRLPTNVDLLVVTPTLVDAAKVTGRQIWAEVTDLATARAAAAAGADGLLASGAEAGGAVGGETAFVLLQRLVDEVDLPIWLRGGIGLHTAGAALVGGARGVVLDAQVALTRESTLAPSVQKAVSAMDGSETIEVAGYRVFTRPDLPAPDPAWTSSDVADRLGGDDLTEQLLPVGQDGAFASDLAARFHTVGGIVTALRRACAEHTTAATTQQALAPGHGIAESVGTRYPVAQGPMTRVSDRPEFAAAVADAGALPFVALSLLRADECRRLLTETQRLLGDRPWGAGILGFVPPELREEQLETLLEVRPPLALIAGGRPSQAAHLDAAGIASFLHVPSPGLLARFWKDGARRFVFEGRECGGHVGPRSSFTLWEQQVEVLLGQADLTEAELLFAGGVHDARSAAMVATLAAPLIERGARIGVLMGTAYVLTPEAVSTGAVTSAFQQEALDARHTVLLETAPGHATRCADTRFVATFEQERRRMEDAGVPASERWAALEELNLGRLRIATKAIRREGDSLVEVDEQVQADEGMYMLGQVAALHGTIRPMVDLHEDVTRKATELLAGATPVPDPARLRPGPMRIAVIGTAAVFPGAGDVTEYWSNIVGGVDAVTEVPADRWSIERYHTEGATPAEGDVELRTPSKWGGFLPDVPFDPAKFGIPPRSLVSIGPDQLLSLEVAAAALADAGYADRDFDRDRAAVVFGAEAGTDLANAYGFRAALPHYFGSVPPELADKLPNFTEDTFPGVLANVIAGRIANRLDLGGPNYTVDAACGASMAALSSACRELLTGTSDLVLCGGTDLHNGIYDYLLFASVHALSATGRCRTFADDADGIALGEGVGCVVLKRLDDAERDGDRILAVIDAVAGSSDGRSLGLTAPRPAGQRRALERAYEQSQISPASVGLVEAHGTGTVVGDKAELSTLAAVYGEHGATTGDCSVGSVKSQIGHTKCAAGVAGLIKAVHAVHRGVLPPTLNVTHPNSAWDESSPFVFNDVARPWLEDDRRAAVSAFGFGGSNFHTVIRSYDDGEAPTAGIDRWPAELFLLRGGDDAELAAACARAVELLDAQDRAGRPWRFRDLARTIHEQGSGPVGHAIVATDEDDLRAQLEALDPSSGPVTPVDRSQVAFLYPGQGSQRPHMLGDLFLAFPALRRHLRSPGVPTDLISPPADFGVDKGRIATALTDTRAAQPALGAAGLAMTELLVRCGVVPGSAGGHSYGELVALAAAGALPAGQLAALSRARGEVILAAAGDDPGTMAAVRGDAPSVTARLEAWPDVVVANDNSPEQCVIAGPTADVDAAVAHLKAEGVTARRIKVACGFHTPTLAPAGDALRDGLEAIDVQAPRFPVWANVTAEPYPADADAVRDLLGRQISSTVRFREQVEAMYEAGVRVFVEAGPGRVLSQLVGAVLGDRPHTAVVCDEPGGPGIPRFLRALAALADAGVTVDPSALYEGRDTRVVDPATAPAPAPYLLNGNLVRHRDGTRVDGSLPPATDFGPIAVGGNGHVLAPGDLREAAVSDYLHGLREMVGAQRDVMLAFLGADSAPWTPSPARALSTTATANGGSNGNGNGAAHTHAATNGNGNGAAASGDQPEAAPAPALDAAGLLALVVSIVSDRTGYPTEMLDPDLDIEAELSIDSIKRIEILGELADRVGLPGMDDTGVDDSVIEELALIKTLRGIVDWIVEAEQAEGGTAPVPPAAPVVSTVPAAEEVTTEVPAELGVSVPVLEEADSDVGVRRLPDHGVVLLGSEDGVAGRLLSLLADVGVTAAVHTDPSGRPAELGPISMLVDCRILADDGGTVPAPVGDPSALTRRITAHFESLKSHLEAGVDEVVVLVGGGGRLGLAPSNGTTAIAVSEAAALRAMAKTAVRETAASVRIVDVDAHLDPDAIAALVLAELRRVEANVEVGLSTAGRVVVGYEPASAQIGSAGPPVALGPGAALLVTGGARGIGARVALAAAERFGCPIEVVGRTPLPHEPEPDHLAAAPDASAIRRVLVGEGRLTSPRAIEDETQRVLAAREVRAAFDDLTRVAPSVRYSQLDVRDADALRSLVDDIRARHGRIGAVIHAAGVREDKLLRDKTAESFERVVATKVEPALVLDAALHDDELLISFGSVSGVFGNAGQIDYAAANAMLDATTLTRAGRGAAALSLDWGPWAGGGMVTPELEREYERRGVGLVQPDEGVGLVLDALAGEVGAHQLVVVRAPLERMQGDREVELYEADEPVLDGVRG